MKKGRTCFLKLNMETISSKNFQHHENIEENQIIPAINYGSNTTKVLILTHTSDILFVIKHTQYQIEKFGSSPLIFPSSRSISTIGHWF